MGPGTVPRLQPGLRLSWSERRDVAQRRRLDRNPPICWSCGLGGWWHGSLRVSGETWAALHR